MIPVAINMNQTVIIASEFFSRPLSSFHLNVQRIGLL